MTRRLPTVAPITAAALILAAAALAGCGRNGPPELPTEQTEVKPVGSELMPGTTLPTKPVAQPVKKKARGDFILDPLL